MWRTFRHPITSVSDNASTHKEVIPMAKKKRATKKKAGKKKAKKKASKKK